MFRHQSHPPSRRPGWGRPVGGPFKSANQLHRRRVEVESRRWREGRIPSFVSQFFPNRPGEIKVDLSHVRNRGCGGPLWSVALAASLGIVLAGWVAAECRVSRDVSPRGGGRPHCAESCGLYDMRDSGRWISLAQG